MRVIRLDVVSCVRTCKSSGDSITPVKKLVERYQFVILFFLQQVYCVRVKNLPGNGIFVAAIFDWSYSDGVLCRPAKCQKRSVPQKTVHTKIAQKEMHQENSGIYVSFLEFGAIGKSYTSFSCISIHFYNIKSSTITNCITLFLKIRQNICFSITNSTSTKFPAVLSNTP